MENTIRVFVLDDYEYWAGESLEACLTSACGQTGGDYREDTSLHRELTADEMDSLIMHDEDGKPLHSFRKELQALQERGESFPCFFAAKDY